MRVDNSNDKHPKFVEILCSCVITINLSSLLPIIDLVLIYVINYSEAVVCYCHYKQYVTVTDKVVISRLISEVVFFKENILVCL